MRPIDADKMKSYIDCGHLRHPDEICLSEHNVVQMLDKQPTLDVEPARHGWWEVVREKGIFGERFLRCSSCKSEQRLMIRFNYCFNCGAKMDAKEE